MQCEICGSENARKRVLIDGSQLNVCEECSHYGKELGPAPRIVVHTVERYSKEPELEQLKENYGEIIRHAREKKGLTLEEFANSIFETESWLRKIEQGKLKPDAKLLSKLEKVLAVKLTGD